MQLTPAGPLRFPVISTKETVPIAGPEDAGSGDKAIERRALRTFLRVAVVSQSMLLCILLAVAALLFVLGARAQNQMELYFEMAMPIVSEITNHSVGIMRDAHSSSSAVNRAVLDAENATRFSIPALLDSVNRTTAAVAAVTRMASHPTLKVSVE